MLSRRRTVGNASPTEVLEAKPTIDCRFQQGVLHERTPEKQLMRATVGNIERRCNVQPSLRRVHHRHADPRH